MIAGAVLFGPHESAPMNADRVRWPQVPSGNTCPTRVPQGIKSYLKGDSKRGTESEEENWRMDSAQHCRDQAAECHHLMKTSKDEAQVPVNISQSWS